MKNKIFKTIIAISVSVLLIIVAVSCAAKFIYLSPSCYSDNDTLTNQENYFIKKIALECVEARLSVFADSNSGIYNSIQLDNDQNNRKHVFIFINRDFMKSVQKEDEGYIVRVQTYGMESVSDDCVYEIHLSNEFDVTFFGLDP